VRLCGRLSLAQAAPVVAVAALLLLLRLSQGKILGEVEGKLVPLPCCLSVSVVLVLVGFRST